MNSTMELLDKAIVEAENWANTGWKVTFGSRNVEVNSIKEAAELKPSFHNRLEAVSYWDDVNTVGGETAAYGRKAKESLGKGDLHGAKNALYFARFIEKRINEDTPTWGPVYAAIESTS